MWTFAATRLRRWILLAIAVPLATTAIHLARVQLEKRSGKTKAVKVLTKLENFGNRQRKSA